MFILQMASSSSYKGGRGNSPKGRGRGRISYFQISIDNEDFTMVTKNKRGGYIGSSSSSSQKQKKKEDISSIEILANSVAKDENSNYVSKNVSMHICYIEQEDVHLLNDPQDIRSKYLTPYQSLSYVDNPRAYYEVVMNQTDRLCK